MFFFFFGGGGGGGLFGVITFVFFAYKMYSPSFVKLQFNPPVVTWIILLISLLRFWTLIVVITLPSIEGQRALGMNKKYLYLCSEDE